MPHHVKSASDNGLAALDYLVQAISRHYYYSAISSTHLSFVVYCDSHGSSLCTADILRCLQENVSKQSSFSPFFSPLKMAVLRFM